MTPEYADYLANEMAGASQVVDTSAPKTEVPKEIPMIFPDGTVSRLPFEAALDAQALGARPATPKELVFDDQVQEAKREAEEGGLLGTATALGAGAFTEFVPGGAWVLKKAATLAGQEEDRAAARLKGLTETTAGRIGAAGALLAPLTKAGQAAGGMMTLADMAGAKVAGLLPQAAPSLVKKGAEAVTRGALYGAHVQANDDTLENQPLTVDRLVHGAAIGAVFDLGLSIPIQRYLDKRAARLVNAPTQKALSASVGPEALSAQERAALKAVGVPGAYPEVSAPLAGQTWMEGGEKQRAIMSGANKLPEEYVHLVAQKMDESGATARWVLGHAKEVKENATKSLLKISDHMEDLAFSGKELLNKNLRQAFDAVKDGIDLGAVGVVSPKVDQYLLDLTAEVNAMHDFARDRAIPNLKPVFEDITKARVGLDSALSSGDRALAAVHVNTIRDEFQRAAMNIQRAVEDVAGKGLADASQLVHLHEKLSGVANEFREFQRLEGVWGPQFVDAFDTTFGAYSRLIQNSDELGTLGFFRKEKNTWGFSPRYAVPSRVESLVNRYNDTAQKRVKEKLQGMFGATAEFMDALSSKYKLPIKTSDLEAVANVVAAQKALEKQLDFMHTVLGPELTGQRAGLLSQAIRVGVGGGLGTLAGAAVGMPWVGAPVGVGLASLVATGMNAGSMVEAKAGLEAFQRKILERRQQKIGQLIAGKPTATPKIITKQNFQQFVTSVSRAAADPAFVSKILAHTFEPISNSHPRTSQAAMERTHAALQLLAQSLPKQPGRRNDLQPKFDRKHPPSEADLARANRTVAAIVDPYSGITNPTPEWLRTMRTLYPTELTDIQADIADRMALAKKPVSFNIQRQLSMVLDFEHAVAGDPRKMAVWQASLQSNRGANAESSAPKRPLKTANSAMPMTSLLESGGSKRK